MYTADGVGLNSLAVIGSGNVRFVVLTSIDHFLLLDQLAEIIRDKRVLNLLGQYLRRTAERGGEFRDYERGISLGCPLSPLMGAFFLKRLDAVMEASGLFYVRFMDDILVLAPTRWRFRRAVKAVNEVLGSLCLLKHPDKTFIGRIERGFDFRGYHFGPEGLSVAKKTIERFVERAIRLYEQDRKERSGPSRLDTYVERWRGWVVGGLTWQQVGPDSSQPFGPQLRLAGGRLS